MGLGDIARAASAMMQNKKVQRRIVKEHMHKMTSPGMAGEDNYNTEQRTLRAYAGNNDAIGAARYAKGQRKKLSQQAKNLRTSVK